MAATRFFLAIRARSSLVLTLLALVTLICGYGALQSKVDNSLPVWQSSDDPHWNRYQAFLKEHKITDPLLILLPDQTVDQTASLTEQLEVMPHVDHVNTIGVIPKTGGHAALISLLPEYDASSKTLSAMLAGVEERLTQSSVSKAHLGGVWLLTDRLDKLSASSTQTMFPLVITLLGAVLIVLLRNTRHTALIMACGLLPGLQLTGLMALVGIKMNMILLALPPLTMILGISHAIHLMTKTATDQEAAMDILARVASPCLLSGLTTALGFLSLLLSNYQPVRQLGFWGAIGALLSLVTSLLILPIFYTPADTKLPFSFKGLLQLIIAWKKLILPGMAITLVAGVIGAQQLQRGSFILDFFTGDSAVRQDYQAIEGAGIGLTPLEIDLGSSRQLSNRQIEKNMLLLTEQRPEITHVLYSFNSGIVVPKASENGAGFLTPADLDFMVEDVSRITLLTQTMASEDTLELVDRIESFCQRNLGARKLPYVTGSVPLYTRGQKKLFATLVTSFSAAFFAISLIMGLVLRSWKLGMLAILPNILPVILVLGAMGVIGIPLSVATVTVASIVFGIVVDDTIHFLHSWKKLQKRYSNRRQALEHVFSYAGPAMMTTSLVAGIGFLGFAVSPFLPLRNFGLLISLAMGLALFCDLVLLPALLLIGKGEGNND